jgi:hypothetical protein
MKIAGIVADKEAANLLLAKADNQYITQLIHKETTHAIVPDFRASTSRWQ